MSCLKSKPSPFYSLVIVFFKVTVVGMVYWAVTELAPHPIQIPEKQKNQKSEWLVLRCGFCDGMIRKGNVLFEGTDNLDFTYRMTQQ